MSQNANTLGPHQVGSTTSMQNLPSAKSDDKVDFFKFDEAAVHNLIDFEASISPKDFFKLFNQEEFHEYIKSIYAMKQKVCFFLGIIAGLTGQIFFGPTNLGFWLKINYRLCRF
jgi:hypothetical protein